MECDSVDVASLKRLSKGKAVEKPEPESDIEEMTSSLLSDIRSKSSVVEARASAPPHDQDALSCCLPHSVELESARLMLLAKCHPGAPFSGTATIPSIFHFFFSAARSQL